mmetsp:Transcript_27525/g.74094  ORF Transcript_27525/g.74094 Transcript_27525/m.74094 type:complete len:254 (-) Transcript_27525:55-816(-)
MTMLPPPREAVEVRLPRRFFCLPPSGEVCETKLASLSRVLRWPRTLSEDSWRPVAAKSFMPPRVEATATSLRRLSGSSLASALTNPLGRRVISSTVWMRCKRSARASLCSTSARARAWLSAESLATFSSRLALSARRSFSVMRTPASSSLVVWSSCMASRLSRTAEMYLELASASCFSRPEAFEACSSSFSLSCCSSAFLTSTILAWFLCRSSRRTMSTMSRVVLPDRLRTTCSRCSSSSMSNSVRRRRMASS